MSAITKTRIFELADEMTAAGRDPTLAAIRAALGGGSFTTISEAMKEWREAASAAAAPIREPTPAALEEKLAALGSELWNVARQEAENRLTAERAALDEKKSELEAAQRQAAELADQIGAELEAEKAAHAATGANAATLKAELEAARQQAAAHVARSNEQADRIGDMKAELERQRAALEAAAKREREASATLAAAAGEISAEKAAHAATGANAAAMKAELEAARQEREILKAARRALENETARLKAELEAEKAAHATSGANAATMKAELEAARQQAAAHVARSNEQASRIEDLRAELGKANAALMAAIANTQPQAVDPANAPTPEEIKEIAAAVAIDGRKAMIADVHRLMERKAGSLEAFKTLLLEYSQAGKIELVRLDMQDGHNPPTRSEIQSGVATFHCIVAPVKKTRKR